MENISKEKRDQLNRFVEEMSVASKRSRRVLLLLIFASIIAFSAYWNSRPQGWAEQRFQIVNKAYEELVLKMHHDSAGFIYDNGQILEEKNLTINPERRNLHDFLSKRNINTTDELEFLKKVYYDLKEGTFKIEVPILGVKFDVNDLGLFSGITLALFLFLLWFCLEREWENLKMTLKEVDEAGELKYYYRIVSMGQVLTVPAKENNPVNLLWIIVPKILYIIPLLVQFLIFINDSSTSSIVNPISEAATTIYNVINILSIAIIFLLTFICFIYIIRIDLVWNEYHKKLHNARGS